MTDSMRLWPAGAMQNVKKWIGYAFGSGASAVTLAATAKYGPWIGGAIGTALGFVGTRILHLTPAPKQ